MAFIVVAAIMQLQNKYMQNYSLGFDKDRIAVVELSLQLYRQHGKTFNEKLKTYPEIADVAFATQKIGSQDVYSTNSSKYEGQKFSFFMLGVSPNFFSTMGIDIVEGCDFSEADANGDNLSCIFNAEAKQNLNMNLGKFNYYSTYEADIVGFSKDIKITSMRQGENNICFYATSRNTPVTYIRIQDGVDVKAAVSHVSEALSEIDASYPFNIEFYDTIYNNLYHNEINLQKLVMLFGVLTVVLSLMGVFGLVMFDSEYRRKEIGVRKVSGSTTQEILSLFGMAYLKIVAVCFVIAAPIAYYVSTKWLEGFAYKTLLHWWVFALSFFIVAFITLVAVMIQNWRAANVNPVDAMKNG
jgi:Predicted permease.